jgi:uncharacterized membrane protein YgcG
MNSHISGNGSMPRTMLPMPEQQKRSVDQNGLAALMSRCSVDRRYKEVHVQDWKRKILNAGVSLSVVGGGVLLAEGAVSAHDAVDHGGPAHHQGLHHLVQGVVSSVGTGSFTITTHRGVSKTIDTTSTTVFSETGTPAVPATVAAGQNVAVSLDPTNPTPTAVRVVIVLNRISGKVLTVTPTSITLTGPHNTTRVVTVLSGTMFFTGTTSATGVTMGQFVTVFGSPDATTPANFDAMFVDVGLAQPQPVVTPPVVTPPVVPPTVPNPNPNPGIGRGDDHGDQNNDGDNDNNGVGDNDNNEHANGDDNGGQEHAPTTPTNVQPATPGTTQQVPPNGNGSNGGPGSSDGGGNSGGQGNDGGGSSGGGSGSGSHGGRG